MSKKPVMGHNPLGYRPLADANFDFIPNTKDGAEAKDNARDKDTPNKKVVSYYLEEELIDKIKKRAKEKEDSYSHFVGTILKKAIND
jgi:nitrogen regulatory protein PII-like uncharacterized protein